MRRLLTLCSAAAAIALASGEPAGAAIRVERGDAELAALAVDARGTALAVVDRGGRSDPFVLVRVAGTRRERIDVFGAEKGEWPSVAAAGGRALVAWARPISGGAELSLAREGDGARLGEPGVAGFATSPGRLAVDAEGRALIAHADERGDVALTGEDGAVATLTADGPERRHLPLDLALTATGPLVLDLGQTRERSELRVLGEGAPAGPVTSVGALRHLHGALAASDALVAVTYLSRGRAVLATAAPGGSWTRRRLPGPGGALDTPVPVIDGDRVHVAYLQRSRRARDVRLATLSDGRVRARRITRDRHDDRRPLAAVGPAGELYVGWTRTHRRSRRHAPRLERVE